MNNTLKISFEVGGADPVKTFAAALGGLPTAVPGLSWRLCLVGEGGGKGVALYRFEDEASLKRFCQGPGLAQLRHQEGVSRVCARAFAMVDELGLYLMRAEARRNDAGEASFEILNPT